MKKGTKESVSDSIDLRLDWHPIKNGKLKMDDITIGSGKKVWWKCHKCGYEWEASVQNRAKGRGCSYCANMVLIEGSNDFATVYPKAAKQWDYEKNFPITPNKVRAHSNRRFWFKCEEGHSWESSLNNRKKNGCPYCGSQKLLKGYNDLATKDPELSEEWHYEKNAPLTPMDIMQFSNIKVWWKCKTCGYEWQTKINARSTGTGCPKCRNDYKVSEAERIIYFYIKKQFEDAIISYRPKWLGRREIDIFVPSLSLGIEYDGEIWHANPDKDIEKSRIIERNGIFLIRLREEKCPFLNDGSYHIIVGSKDYRYARLNQPIAEIFDYINEKYRLSVNYDIDAERDYQDILALTAQDKKEKSLQAKNPELCEDWNYARNKLEPQYVLPLSNKTVWWKCRKCGYEWRAAICNRVKGRGCPLCSNKVIVIGKNDLATVSPQISEEWNYEKNGLLTPQDVSVGSSKRVWWKCSACGYEWITSVANRKKNNCPQCAVKKRANANIKNRVIVGENDLGTQYPELAKEWNKTKNGDITPMQICAGSNIAVWWICDKGHEWRETVNARTQHPGKCPFCSDRRVREGYNDLLTLCPELCEEWDYAKNKDISPTQITKKYGKKIWWKCTSCGTSGKQLYERDLLDVDVLLVRIRTE